MKRHVDALVREALRGAIDRGTVRSRREVSFQIEPPRHAEFGDLACDVGLALARAGGDSPHELAGEVVDRLRDPHGWLAAVTIGGPGFVNFRFSLAFWRRALSEALAAGPAWGRSPGGAAGRALLGVVANGDAGPADTRLARAGVVARAVARMLGEGGWSVTSADAAPPPDVDLAIAVLVPTRGPEVERFRAALPGSPALRVIGVQPVRLRRNGQAVEGGLDRETLDGASRFLLLLERADRPVELDRELAASRCTDSPAFLVRYAQARLSRVRAERPEPGTVSAAELDGLDESDVEVLRALASWPDVVEVAAQALEPDRVARHAVSAAMAAHRWANRHRVLDAAVALLPARVALAGCLDGMLSRAAALCGMTMDEGS